MMLLNCGVGEDSWNSLRLQVHPTNPYKGNQSWIFIGRSDAKSETAILWPPGVKNESLEKTVMLGKIKVGRRRGWQRMRWLDDNLTQCTWVSVSSGSWRWTGRLGVLQSVGLQGVGHDWATELNWTGTEYYEYKKYISDYQAQVASKMNSEIQKSLNYL